MMTPQRSVPVTAAGKASGAARDLLGSLVQVVGVLSAEGFPHVGLTANMLGVSVRTLQRHLAEAGTTYAAEVEHARFAAAASLLEETDVPVLIVALDLGYSDHAHFSRAFRRWSGRTPREFRRLTRESHDDPPATPTAA
jgi:AraC-like DNA-binding protein